MMLIVNCDDGCDGDSSDDGGDNQSDTEIRQETFESVGQKQILSTKNTKNVYLNIICGGSRRLKMLSSSTKIQI